ncbi:hypothetical protein BGI41_03210 [Methanobrevibacter sp. 87.7]|uniref:helix-turn-helix transcriptional regulator n=1 Tax=Methanobrevibacter sp. 87.7 TaxID=387957 RepID=UPI000B4FFC60|nr:transcriptional regulator FilR1 domain-containing protein [Methanobrevibacter sp. 87.7]OWT33286.1 hypothetical protein BGI41_03210 [Methanobrevibacter sp. 87.7]
MSNKANILLNKTISLTRSKLKSYVFLNLVNQNKNFSELKLLGQTSSISNTIHYFEDNQIIGLKNDDSYGLASEGEIIAINYLNFLDAWPTKGVSDFLNKHIIDDIPSPFIDKLYLLHNGKLLTYDFNSPYESFNVYTNLISKTHSLNIVLSICSSEHIKILSNLVSTDSSFILNIIVTDSILYELYKNHTEDFNILLTLSNVNFYKSNSELDIFLNSGSNFLSIQLFDLDNEYDTMFMFYDTSKSGTLWGKKLFNYFLNDSKKLNIKSSNDLDKYFIKE